MDPSKKIGKIKEQIEREHNARRKYPTKWGVLVDPELNKFYNQNDINRQLKESQGLNDSRRYISNLLNPIRLNMVLINKANINSDGVECIINSFRTDRLGLKINADCRLSRYSNEGESYFVSKGMYDSLCTQCRCGRPRTETHIIRCLQKERDRFEKTTESSSAGAMGNRNIPETSNGAFGFVPKKPIYQQWEQSMKYVSPVYTMPGYKITISPYNAIIIG